MPKNKTSIGKMAAILGEQAAEAVPNVQVERPKKIVASMEGVTGLMRRLKLPQIRRMMKESNDTQRDTMMRELLRMASTYELEAWKELIQDRLDAEDTEDEDWDGENYGSDEYDPVEALISMSPLGLGSTSGARGRSNWRLTLPASIPASSVSSITVPFDNAEIENMIAEEDSDDSVLIVNFTRPVRIISGAYMHVETRVRRRRRIITGTNLLRVSAVHRNMAELSTLTEYADDDE